MSESYAKVIADSIYDGGPRLTTFEVRFHRFVLAEWNTHRTFSRNSESSRAVPLEKRLDAVRDDPARPLVFPVEQRGMQGGESLGEMALGQAQDVWGWASRQAAMAAEELGSIGVHKSVANRLLEPFLMHTVVVTATALENFFRQRAHEAAQPEIRVPAEMMLAAYEASTPTLLQAGDWHLPYVADDQQACLWAGEQFGVGTDGCFRALAQISAARCAGVSYLTQGSEGRDPERDLTVVYPRLVVRDDNPQDPRHWSPLEHVATPWADNRQEGWLSFSGKRHEIELDHLPRVGNLLGWRSLRTTVEAEVGEVTYR